MNVFREKKFLVFIWKTNIRDKPKDWVLFKHGTCVIIQEPITNLELQAKELLKRWGAVIPGTNLGDFIVKQADDSIGWLVTYTHPDIANYVHLSELPEDFHKSDTVTIGLIGREKRQNDAKSLVIIHKERVK